MANFDLQSLLGSMGPIPDMYPFAAQGGSGPAQAARNALMNLTNMPAAPPVSGPGAGISSVAQGLVGAQMQRAQLNMMRYMMPIQMAEKAIGLQKELAPQAITTPYGIASRNQLTGEVSPGMSPLELAKMNSGAFGSDSNGLMGNIMSMVPDADPREQGMLRGIAQTASQFYDPQKRAEYIQNGVKDIYDKRLTHQQWQMMYDQNAQYKSILAQTQQMNADTRRMMAENMNQELDLRKAQFADKLYDPAIGADERYAKMLDAVQHPNAQNDISLLFNHIGMTMGAQRGSRMTEVEIQRAVQSRSLPEELLGQFQRLGIVPDQLYRMLGQDPKKLPPGGFLTPQQRQQMMQLADVVRNVSWTNARREASRFGVMQYEPAPYQGLPNVPIPTNLLANPMLPPGYSQPGSARRPQTPSAPRQQVNWSDLPDAQ